MIRVKTAQATKHAQNAVGNSSVRPPSARTARQGSAAKRRCRRPPQVRQLSRAGTRVLCADRSNASGDALGEPRPARRGDQQAEPLSSGQWRPLASRPKQRSGCPRFDHGIRSSHPGRQPARPRMFDQNAWIFVFGPESRETRVDLQGAIRDRCRLFSRRACASSRSS